MAAQIHKKDKEELIQHFQQNNFSKDDLQAKCYQLEKELRDIYSQFSKNPREAYAKVSEVPVPNVSAADEQLNNKTPAFLAEASENPVSFGVSSPGGSDPMMQVKFDNDLPSMLENMGAYSELGATHES